MYAKGKVENDTKHTIVLYRTHMDILNYDMNDVPRLEYIFTISDMCKSYLKYIEYNQETKTLILPRALNPKWIHQFFPGAKIINNSHIRDKAIVVSGGYHLRYPPNSDIQVECLHFTLGEDKYVRNKNAAQLSINLKTGKGKTYVALATVAAIGCKAIIINNLNGLLKEWNEKAMEYLGLKEEEILNISSHKLSSQRIIDDIIENPELANEYKIFLVNHTSLAMYGNIHGWDKVTKFFQAIGVGVKIFDEAHCYFENMTRIDYHTATFRTFYLTATLMRSNAMENAIFQNYFYMIPKIDLFDPSKDRKTTYIGLLFNSHPKAKDISKFMNYYGLNNPKYIDYILENEYFKKCIDIIVEKFIMKLSGRILVFIGLNRAIVTIKNYLEENYPILKGSIGIYSSINAKGKEKAKEKRIILTTMKSAMMGLNIKYLKASIVLAEPFSSSVWAIQSLGRTDRTNEIALNNTFYIELVDIGCYQINKYYNKKKNTFSKYCKKIVEVHLNVDKEYIKIQKKREAIEAKLKLNSIVPFKRITK